MSGRALLIVVVYGCVGCSDGGAPKEVAEVEVETVDLSDVIETADDVPDALLETELEIEVALETEVSDLCVPDPCSGHGACSNAAETFACACDEGYLGVACERCADGFRDERGDGICVASTCGDGVVDVGEQCDSVTPSLLCDDDCQFACEVPEGASAAFLLSSGCYFVFDAPATYAEAAAICGANAASHLAAPTTAWEEYYVFDAVEGEAWLALGGGPTGLDAAWSTGEPVTYTRFDAARPPLGAEYCVARDERGWFEADCAETRAFVCEVTTCGNGFVDANEGCDDGNRINGDGCDNHCQVTGCGNQLRDPSEDCETAGPGFEPGCPDTCRFACGSQAGANHTIASNSNCYAFYFQEADAAGADALCESLGLLLAKVTSVADGEALAMYYAPAWIGLSDEEAEGTFLWRDGSMPTETAWAADQPSSGDGEDCVELGPRGRWNDVRCSISRSVICSTCGNGRLDDPEACDDANAVDGDGCETDCTVTP